MGEEEIRERKKEGRMIRRERKQHKKYDRKRGEKL